MKKVAIAVLTKGYTDLNQYSQLIERNNSIFNHLSTQSFEADVIIFHEGNIPQDHQDYISNKSKGDLTFINVKTWGPKSGFDNNRDVVNPKLCPPTSLSSSFHLGYKHMCMFWSIDFFEYLPNYKYVIRIDEDCILQEFDFRRLKYMKINNIKFSSPFFGPQDVAGVVVGLDKLRIDFLQKHNLPINVQFDKILTPYTNFMIVDLEFFRNHELTQSFLKEVDRCGGIYSNRWGDSPVWAVLLTFLPEEYYVEDKTVKYYHGSHNRQIN